MPTPLRASGVNARTAGRPAKRNRSSRMLLFSIVILALIGGAVALYSLVFSKRESTVSMTQTPIQTTATYLNTGDGLLYQTDGQIHFLHLTDSRRNYTYGTAASDIRMSGSKAMTCVFNDLSLQVIGKGNTPVSFTGRVLAVECGAGYLGVLRRAEDGTESVLIITPTGEQVGELSYPDQFIVDFGFYMLQSERMWVETLGVNTGTPATTITTYDVSKAANTGVMQVQTQLIDDIYITENSLFVVGTNQIIRYVHDGNKEIYRTTVYGYEVIDYTLADSPTFLMTPRGGDMHSVKLLTLAEDDEPGAVETYLQLSAEGVAAFMMNGRLIVVSRDQLFTYTVKGKLSKTANFEYPVDAAVKLTENVLLLSSDGLYYTAKIS